MPSRKSSDSGEQVLDIGAFADPIDNVAGVFLDLQIADDTPITEEEIAFPKGVKLEQIERGFRDLLKNEANGRAVVLTEAPTYHELKSGGFAGKIAYYLAVPFPARGKPYDGS